MRIITNTAQETIEFGKKIAKKLSKHINTIYLTGPLGSGKTTLIKGIAKGLGIRKIVTSPSFLTLKTYKSSKTVLNHLDFYKLKKTDAQRLYVENCLSQKHDDCVFVIEWAEKIRPLFQKKQILITLKHAKSPNQRIIKVSTT